jgi:hypothetical protein
MIFAQEENITKQDIEKDFLKLHIRNLRKSENL